MFVLYFPLMASVISFRPSVTDLNSLGFTPALHLLVTVLFPPKDYLFVDIVFVGL